MKIIKLFYIIALCSVLNTHGMFRLNPFLKLRNPGMPSFRKILSDEEKSFYREQANLARSEIRVNQEKERYYKEQATFTKYKKYVCGLIVGTSLIMEIVDPALGLRDLNGYTISPPISAILFLPAALFTYLRYTNADLIQKYYLKTQEIKQK